MMKRQLIDAIEVCIAELDAGADLRSCLRIYPHLQSELRPILEAHHYARMIAVPGPSRAAADMSRTQMLARAHEARRAPQRRTVRLPRFAEALLAIAIVVFVTGGGIWAASAGAVPGDPLYAFKLAFEDISLKLAPSRSLKASLEDTYQERRLEETQELLTLGREEEVVFEGEVTELGLESFVVEGLTITLTDSTEIVGSFREGDGVEIRAVIRDGIIIEAYTVRLRSYWLVDHVVSISDEIWVVGETRLEIDVLTDIDEDVGVGDQVIVIVEIMEEGLDYAKSIRRRGEFSPEPTRTPPPPSEPDETATPTPEGVDRQIYGMVQQIGGDSWSIGGETVMISDETAIEEGIGVGDFVVVDAVRLWDGIFVARRIRSGVSFTREPGAGIQTPFVTPEVTDGPTGTPEGGGDEIVHFTGVIQSKFTNRWRIGNQLVRVTDNTEVIGDPQVGDLVAVDAVEGPLRGLIARRIEVVEE